jgi:IPT/TIG domain
VSGGPYEIVDTDGDGFATVALDGSGSHTHRFPGQLVSFSWKLDSNNQVFSTDETCNHVFGVGVHSITLTVRDNGNSVASESTTVTVYNATTPDIAELNPNTGSMTGGYPVLLVGSAFANFAPADIVVTFNGIPLTGPLQIEIISDTTIQVLAPSSTSSGSRQVSVTTPLGTSAPRTFAYIDSSVPVVNFTHGDVLTGISGPTSIAYGPDGKLYVGTQAGGLYKLTLNASYHVVNTVGPSFVLNNGYPGTWQCKLCVWVLTNYDYVCCFMFVCKSLFIFNAQTNTAAHMLFRRVVSK